MRRHLVLLLLTIAPAAYATAPAAPPSSPPPVEVPDLGAGDKLKFLVGHRFPRADAKIRVRQLLDYWGSRFGVKSRWTGDHVLLSGRVFGVDFKARLDVDDTCVGGEATDPGGLLRSSARDYVKGKLRKYLNPNYEEP